MQNVQAPEKRVISDGSHLAVNSIFHTIQGEGPFVGSPATFVRLAGCNLQCPLCDTEYTNRSDMSIAKILAGIMLATPSGHQIPELVVLTGGEPFRQSIGPLIHALIEIGYKVQIETNGTLFQNGLPLGDPSLTIVSSPKAGAINKKLMPYINALKYVATVDSLKDSPDGLPMHALEHPNGGMLARPPDGFKGIVYLQPVDEQDTRRGGANDKNLAAVVESCQKYGHRLCLQVHKIIGVD